MHVSSHFISFHVVYGHQFIGQVNVPLLSEPVLPDGWACMGCLVFPRGQTQPVSERGLSRLTIKYVMVDEQIMSWQMKN